MAKSPAFQFYTKDWLSSAAVQLMTPAQEGAYIRLLAFCWESGDCSLPDDDQQLSVLSRLGEGWFNGGSALVRKCFTPHPTKAGYLTNIRLIEEANKQAAWRKKSAEGGRKSARQRSGKQSDLKCGSHLAKEPLQPNPNSSSPSASSKDSGTEVPSLPPTPKEPIDYQMMVDIWNETAGQLCPKVGKIVDSRRRGLQSRMADTFDGSIDNWRSYCVLIQNSAFLTGSSGRGWRADFDWALKPLNATKVLEGKYANTIGKPNGFAEQDYHANTEGFVTT